MNPVVLPTEQEDDVQQILNQQREESEAREIVRDVSNQHSLAPEKKGRWIWEILQNARDAAQEDDSGKRSVTVTLHLQPDSITVRHNGKPFKTGELVALFRRTSTKGIAGQEGATGKYGTGFVTTHVLNKIVQISGLLQTQAGLKEFTLEMNRSFDEIADMQHELGQVFDRIEEIRKDGALSTAMETFTSFHFKLNERTRQTAINTVAELVNNIVFTLLCNPVIETVTITDDIGGTKYNLSLSLPIKIGEQLEYFRSHAATAEKPEHGVLSFINEQNFVVGTRVEMINGTYRINDIGNQARFYKELPMVGTEGAHLPFFIQHPDFRPPEPRDGLRILKDDENAPDKTADGNRNILAQLPTVLIEFFKACENVDIGNLHLLAESGLPFDKYNYCDIVWYEKNIQHPLRTYYTSIPLVTTGAAEPTLIKDCRFIYSDGSPYSETLYSLCAGLYPDKFPSAETWKEWSTIIFQDQSQWPSGIVYGLDELITDLHQYTKLEEIPLSDNEARIEWFNRFHGLLRDQQMLTVADTKPLFISQANNLVTRSSLHIDSIHNKDFKQFVDVFDHSIEDRLLHDDLTVRDGIEAFNAEEFTGSFHQKLGTLKPDSFTDDQVTALLRIVSLFRSTRAPARMELYGIVQELLGEKVPAILQVEDLEFYKWDTVDDAVSRYTCFLIEKGERLDPFSETYFNGNITLTIQWLNRFYKFLATNEQNRKIREGYKIFLVQSGYFNSWDAGIAYENSDKQFEKLFKDAYRDHVKEADPYSFLIDRRINNEGFDLIDLKDITTAIDKLFGSESAERNVREGEMYNGLFHQINDFARDFDWRARDLFPIFMKVQADLLLKAMGKTISKKVLILQRMNRTEEELEKMTKLTLPADQLQSLEKAALQVGAAKLIEKAEELRMASVQSVWKKVVGKRAEEAFDAAIKGVSIEALVVDNLDHGCDYTLNIKGSGKVDYQVEIKSTGFDKSTVKMSMAQGESASNNENSYSLCVIPRDINDEVSVQDFIASSRFVPTIGMLVKDKIDGINSGLLDIEKEAIGDVNVSLENKRYSVNVNQKVWDPGGIGFNDFVVLLKQYLGVS